MSELRIWRVGDNVYVCRDRKLWDNRIQPQHLVMVYGHPLWKPHAEGAEIEPLLVAEEARALDVSDTPEQA